MVIHYSNTKSTTTHCHSPYRSLYDFNSRTIHVENDYELSFPTAEEWLHGMTTVHHHIHDTLKHINEKPTCIYIEKVSLCNIDAWVLVDRRKLQVNAGNNKSLTRKWGVHYKVIKSIGCHAHKLNVLEGYRWPNVVHTRLLTSFRRCDEPQDMDEGEAEVQEVEEIVNFSIVKGVVQYWVRWAGYTEYEYTWETIGHLYKCADKLLDFPQKFPRNLRDDREVWLWPQASVCQSRLLEMVLLHGTFYPSSSSPFPTGCLPRGLGSNGHGMHV